MNTLIHLNKKTLYLGLTGVQLGVIAMACLWSFTVSYVLGAAVCMISIAIIAIIKTQVKMGNPDPVKAWITAARSPQKLEDKNNILRYL